MKHTKELVFDEADIQKIMENHVRNYEYHNENKAPVAIVLPMVSQLHFKTLGHTEGITIPVRYTSVTQAKSEGRSDISLNEADIIRNEAGRILEAEIARADSPVVNSTSVSR